MEIGKIKGKMPSPLPNRSLGTCALINWPWFLRFVLYCYFKKIWISFSQSIPQDKSQSMHSQCYLKWTVNFLLWLEHPFRSSITYGRTDRHRQTDRQTPTDTGQLYLVKIFNYLKGEGRGGGGGGGGGRQLWKRGEGGGGVMVGRLPPSPSLD